MPKQIPNQTSRVDYQLCGRKRVRSLMSIFWGRKGMSSSMKTGAHEPSHSRDTLGPGLGLGARLRLAAGHEPIPAHPAAASHTTRGKADSKREGKTDFHEESATRRNTGAFRARGRGGQPQQKETLTFAVECTRWQVQHMAGS